MLAEEHYICMAILQRAEYLLEHRIMPTLERWEQDVLFAKLEPLPQRSGNDGQALRGADLNQPLAHRPRQRLGQLIVGVVDHALAGQPTLAAIVPLELLQVGGRSEER